VGQAWDRWLEKQAEFYKSFGDTERAQRDSLFELAYLMTRPQLASDVEKKKHDYAATKLGELLPLMESALGAIKACGSQVVPEDGTPALDLSELSRNLEDSAFHIQEALRFLVKPRGRSANALSHCVMFLSDLGSCKVTEKDALALTRLLMKAHGFQEDDLIILSGFSRKSFSIDSISREPKRTGTAHKRVQALISSKFDMVESLLESRRIHKKEPPFNPALYKQKQD